MSAKSPYPRDNIASNPEAFTSPTKSKGELKPKNSKLISLSASPCLSSVLTIGQMPPSLPETSLHPTPVNSIFNIND